jgi:hypothetical protein
MPWQPINPCDSPYNADPTGAADSTAAINAAIAASVSQNYGSICIAFPPGVFLFSSLEIWRNSGSVMITGAGRNVTTLRQLPGSNKDAITFGLPSATSQNTNYAKLKDMTLDGNGSTQNTGSLLVIDGANYFSLEDVLLFDAYNHACHITGTATNYISGGLNATRVQVQDYPYSNWRRQGHGFFFDSVSQQNNMTDCDISGGQLNSNNVAGIAIYGCGDLSIKGGSIWTDCMKVMITNSINVRLSSVNLNSNAETEPVIGAQIYNSSNCALVGLSCYGIQGSAISVGGSQGAGSYNNSVTGCTIEGNISAMAAIGIQEWGTAGANAYIGNTVRWVKSPLSIGGSYGGSSNIGNV